MRQKKGIRERRLEETGAVPIQEVTLHHKSGKEPPKKVRMWVLKQDGDLSSDPNVLQRELIEDETLDQFEPFYASERLLAPPYNFNRLYRIYEDADILQECVDAMKQNVDGFGYQMMFTGDDVKERETPQAKAELLKANNFFDYANETQSFATIRKLMREDYEVIGNGAFEIVRNRLQEVAMMYYAPFRNLRLGAMERKPVNIDVTIPRNGKPTTIKVGRYFRKFAQISALGGQNLRWFKAFGDPRMMDATDGVFKKNPADVKIPATEILHFKIAMGNLPYGIPKWIGVVLDVMGRHSSQYVNYDLFESQGIPPMAILISGGTLTDESIDDLNALVRSMRGSEKWNRVLVLETLVESVGLDEKGSAKVELKNLSEYRKEDLMFKDYQISTEETIRHRWRLPPMYTGSTESFTHATAKSSKEVAEEQVFIPERAEFDEVVNNTIVNPELKLTLWKYKTNGPKMVGAEEISVGVKTFADAGAFSANNAIQMANEAFGLSMSKFDKPWANYPIPIILELVKAGRLIGLEEISKDLAPVSNTLQQITGANPQKQITLLPEQIQKSDFFSEEEKTLYKRLRTIQLAVESIGQETCQ
jgi:PBSX family phage portal protein